jgi:ribosome maturation factor RimP
VGRRGRRSDRRARGGREAGGSEGRAPFERDRERRRERRGGAPAGPDERLRVEGEARRAIEGAGFEVVLARASANRRLVVMVERPDRAPVTVGDCASANRAIEEGLRAAGVDPGAYDIEVESPGADRPLTRPEDFARFQGARITVSLREARDGRRNFTGPLVAYSAGDVTVHVLDEPEPSTFRAAEIREVRLHPEPEKPPPEPSRRRR